jgi:hypothetical protein
MPRKERGGWIMKKILFTLIAIVVLGALAIGGYKIYNEYFVYTPSMFVTTTPAPTAPTASAPSASAQIPTVNPPQADQPTVIIPNDQSLVSRRKPVIGKRQITRVDQTNKNQIEIPGQPPMETREVISQRMSTSVLNVHTDGSFEIEIAFLSMSLEEESQKGKITVSSDAGAPQDQEAKLMWNMVKAMSGSKIKVFITKDLDVRKVEGIETIIEKLRASYPPQALQAIQANLNEDIFKDMMKPFVQVLPAHPVRVGDDWSVTSTIDIPMFGKMNKDRKYHFAKWEEHMGQQCIVVKMSGSISSKGEANPQIPMGPKISITEGSITGTMWYAPALGTVVDSVLIQSINLDRTQKIRDRNGFREEKAKCLVTKNIRSQLIAIEDVK